MAKKRVVKKARFFKTPSARSRGANQQMSGDVGMLQNSFTNAVPIDSSPLTFIPNTMVQGVDTANRIGRKAFIKTLQCKGSVVANTLTGATRVRMAVVWDKQANGSLATFGEVWDTAPTAGVDVSCMRNIDYINRFEVLKDETVAICGNYSTAPAENSIYIIDWFIPVNRETTYNAQNTGTIADIETGALLIFMWGELVSNKPLLGSFIPRIRFVQ